MELLTIEDVESAIPAHTSIKVTDDLVNALNNLSSDPIASETMRDNFITYKSIMKEGKFKLDDYVAAVVYVSYRMMGQSQHESYKNTFPERYKRLIAKGTSDKAISSYVSAYNKNKLVNLITEQTLIPVWILNQGVYQEAINTQAELMKNAKSEKVRSDAANSLLTHLKRPEEKKVELSIGVADTSGMSELKDKLRELASFQQDMIRGGAPTSQIAEQSLMKKDPIEDAEVIEND